MELIELMELVKGKQLIRDQTESKAKIEMKESEHGTDGIYEIHGANTTNGEIDIHGADLSDEIDGTYENNRIGVFFIDVMEFQKRNNQWHRRYSLN